MHQTNFPLAFWLLLPAKRNVKIKPEDQYSIFAYQMQSALRLTVGFLKMYFELYQICNFCVTNLFKH